MQRKMKNFGHWEKKKKKQILSLKLILVTREAKAQIALMLHFERRRFCSIFSKGTNQLVWMKIGLVIEIFSELIDKVMNCWYTCVV